MKFIDYKEFNKVYTDLKSGPLNNQDGEGFGMSVERRCLKEKGQKYVSLVSKNIQDCSINYNDAIDYLSIKSKDLEKVTSKVQ
jgi:hypothetical protein